MSDMEERMARWEADAERILLEMRNEQPWTTAHFALELSRAHKAAAARIAELEAERDRLKAALRPFADYADLATREHPGWDHDEFKVPVPDFVFRMAVFRAARAALIPSGE